MGALYRAKGLYAGDKPELNGGAGLGYMEYRDKGWGNGQRTIKGGSLGAVIEGSLGYQIVKDCLRRLT